ncbi:MAG: glycosyltransferase [Alphaproteobacteria bacterium]|nr:glycosyltransferase [Alphaproteobacteria bacterium]
MKGFRAALPSAQIYVFDNNSSDNTAAIAEAAGAIVCPVRAQGKGHVMRQAFAKVDADIYVMADGDGTYEAAKANDLVQELIRGDLDMVVGVRRHDNPASFRPGHLFGNKQFKGLVRFLFAEEIKDIFSGYRVLSRAFVKSFPALATGFETEAEMSLHAIQLELPFCEIDTRYGPRREGTASKLNTFRDGFRILFFILRLLRYMRPMFLFSILSTSVAAISLAIGIPVVLEFLETGLVPRLPTAVAAAALMVIAAIGYVTGLILDNIAYAQREQKRLAYLSAAPDRTG